jgi:hypothetical protein
VLVLDACTWYLFKAKHLAVYERQLRQLRSTIASRMPSSTLLIWLSPPPQSTLDSLPKPDLPAEWAPVFARVAGDLGFHYPRGPAHHLDMLHLALGGTEHSDCRCHMPYAASDAGTH